jgi:hypothetical protein
MEIAQWAMTAGCSAAAGLHADDCPRVSLNALFNFHSSNGNGSTSASVSAGARGACTLLLGEDDGEDTT